VDVDYVLAEDPNEELKTTNYPRPPDDSCVVIGEKTQQYYIQLIFYVDRLPVGPQPDRDQSGCC